LRMGRMRREDEEGKEMGEERLLKDEEEKVFSRNKSCIESESCFSLRNCRVFSSRLASLSLSLLIVNLASLSSPTCHRTAPWTPRYEDRF
jgi:hypothetical protein